MLTTVDVIWQKTYFFPHCKTLLQQLAHTKFPAVYIRLPMWSGERDRRSLPLAHPVVCDDSLSLALPKLLPQNRKRCFFKISVWRRIKSVLTGSQWSFTPLVAIWSCLSLSVSPFCVSHAHEWRWLMMKIAYGCQQSVILEYFKKSAADVVWERKLELKWCTWCDLVTLKSTFVFLQENPTWHL